MCDLMYVCATCFTYLILHTFILTIKKNYIILFKKINENVDALINKIK